MEVYKKTYKVKKPEEIFSVLEDHMSVLSAQKTTLFYESFKTVIE
jgi:dynein heavy chain